MKSWSAEWVTTGYAVYAGTTIMASMWIGSLVDRVGAVRLYVYSLSPYIVGTLILGVFDHAAWAWVYLGLYGVGSGIKATLIPVFLSELYGTRHIGAIRSFIATLSVFASALGPPALGFALDLDVSISTMTLVLVAYFVGSSLLMVFSPRGAGMSDARTGYLRFACRSWLLFDSISHQVRAITGEHLAVDGLRLQVTVMPKYHRRIRAAQESAAPGCVHVQRLMRATQPCYSPVLWTLGARHG